MAEEEAARRKRYVCSHCGSERVLLDAWAAWSVESQSWKLADIFQNAYCEDCSGEATLVAVEIQRRPMQSIA